MWKYELFNYWNSFTHFGEISVPFSASQHGHSFLSWGGNVFTDDGGGRCLPCWRGVGLPWLYFRKMKIIVSRHHFLKVQEQGVYGFWGGFSRSDEINCPEDGPLPFLCVCTAAGTARLRLGILDASAKQMMIIKISRTSLSKSRKTPTRMQIYSNYWQGSWDFWLQKQVWKS